MARAAAIAALVAGLLLAACGSDDDAAEPPVEPPPGGAVEAVTELDVSLDPDGEGPEPAESVQVLCDPELPAQPTERACELVAELPDDAGEPTPPGQACTQIYGGPDVVSIFGTLEGEQVDIELTRTDGCEIARFEPFVPLLQELFEGYEPGIGDVA